MLMVLRGSSVLDGWMVVTEMRSDRGVIVEVVECMESDESEDKRLRRSLARDSLGN